jgi:hypothetical protein
MRNKRLAIASCLLIAIWMTLSSCGLNIDRNPDGSLNVEVNMSEEAIQAEIEAAIADPLMREFEADLNSGYILVSAERERVSSDVTDTLTFRLDLGISDGHLTATISDTRLDGIPVSEEHEAVWNERIATQLERAGQRNPDSSLQAVTITEDDITMLWRVETWRSRDD